MPKQFRLFGLFSCHNATQKNTHRNLPLLKWALGGLNREKLLPLRDEKHIAPQLAHLISSTTIIKNFSACRERENKEICPKTKQYLPFRSLPWSLQ
ncbi:MAG: hypothetical protein IT273_01820 [Chitinophagales bacterium]|nr:hypothetical protein [Chitinophagales bacterium]